MLPDASEYFRYLRPESGVECVDSVGGLTQRRAHYQEHPFDASPINLLSEGAISSLIYHESIQPSRKVDRRHTRSCLLSAKVTTWNTNIDVDHQLISA